MKPADLLCSPALEWAASVILTFFQFQFLFLETFLALVRLLEGLKRPRLEDECERVLAHLRPRRQDLSADLGSPEPGTCWTQSLKLWTTSWLIIKRINWFTKTWNFNVRNQFCYLSKKLYRVSNLYVCSCQILLNKDGSKILKGVKRSFLDPHKSSFIMLLKDYHSI